MIAISSAKSWKINSEDILCFIGSSYMSTGKETERSSEICSEAS